MEDAMGRFVSEEILDVSEYTKVVIVGYYQLPEESAEGFANPIALCNDELVDLTGRYEALAGTYPSLFYLETDGLMNQALEYYQEDLLRPSVTGAELLEEALATEVLGVN